jgi:hypothetical protein
LHQEKTGNPVHRLHQVFVAILLPSDLISTSSNKTFKASQNRAYALANCNGHEDKRSGFESCLLNPVVSKVRNIHTRSKSYERRTLLLHTTTKLVL